MPSAVASAPLQKKPGAAAHGAQLAFELAPTAGEKKPERHAHLHDDDPAEGAIWFTGQGAHERPELLKGRLHWRKLGAGYERPGEDAVADPPSLLNEPAGHCTQERAPGALKPQPGRHESAHAAAPAPLTVALGHGVQDADSPRAKVPASQRAGAEEPAAHALPAGHGAHADALAK